MLLLQASAVLLARFAILASANPSKEDAPELYRLAPGELVPENATFSSADLFPEFALKSAVSPQMVNPNPGAWQNLFKRQNCQFLRGGDIFTCVNANNRCCTSADNPLDGWCCDATDACGPGTAGTDCTFRISWSTRTMWETEYSTRYWTYTEYDSDSTVWRTSTWTEYEYNLKRDLGTATVWEAVIVNRRDAPALDPRKVRNPAAAVAPLRSTALPAATEVEKREASGPAVTEAPKVLQIRGKLFPRQTLRTDTSVLTVTRTTTIYTTIDTTTTVLDAATSITYTTVTSTLGAGETAPTQSFDDDFWDGPESGGPDELPSSGKKGLGVGAKAGIGVGVGVAVLAAAGIASYFFKHKTGASAAAKAAASAGAGSGNAPSAPPQGAQPGQPAPGYTDGMTKYAMHDVQPVGDGNGMQSPSPSQMHGAQPSMGQPYGDGMSMQHPPSQVQGMQPGQMGPTFAEGTHPQSFQSVPPAAEGLNGSGTMSPPPGSETGFSQATQMGQTPTVGYSTPSPVPGPVPVPLPIPGYYNPNEAHGQSQNQNQNQNQSPTQSHAVPPPGQVQQPQQPQQHEMAGSPVPFPVTQHQQQYPPPPPPQPYMSSSPPPEQQQYQPTPSPPQQQYQYPPPPGANMAGSPTSPGFAHQNQGQYQQPLPHDMPIVYAPQPGNQQQYGQYNPGQQR